MPQAFGVRLMTSAATVADGVRKRVPQACQSPPRTSAATSATIAVAFAAFLTSPLWAHDWQNGPGFRWAELPHPALHAPGFTRLPAVPMGITFTNALSDERSITNRNLLSGSGVAIGDVDGDGRPDLYFCGLDSDNRLYRNLGDWRFEDITDSAGVACPGADATGAAFADVDGDGDLDLLVNSLGGGTRLFLNDGHGHFTETTDAAGLRTATGATSLALADVDGDGDLDLYVANFRPTTILDQPTSKFSMRQENGHPVVKAFNGRPVTDPDLQDRFLVGPDGQVLETGEADHLWLNDGKGHFTRVDWTGGAFVDETGRALTEPPRDWGLAVQFHDLNNDGRPDLYVCNDLWTPDRIWINESSGGKVRFRALDNRSLRNNPTFSMGADFGDLNRDGHVDFFAVDMLSRFHTNRHTQLAAMGPEPRPPGLIDDRVQMKRNVLQLGRGDGTFAEAAFQGGVEASEWSWGPVLLDVDLDGYEDILVSNGQTRDFQDSDAAERVAMMQRGGRLTQARINDLVRLLPRLRNAKVAFHNRGDATFEEVGAQWGFADPSISQGMALADLDGDGDLDVVLNVLFDGPAIYRNETSAPRLAICLKGPAGNSRGIGARITVSPPPGSRLPVQVQEILAGGRYLSGDEPLRVFAAAEKGPMRVEVRWADTGISVVADAAAGRIYEINHAGEVMMKRAADPEPVRYFEEATAKLHHVHIEEPFDDFARQPLLPNRLSQLGPGVTWADLDGDGVDELVIGSGKGGPIAAYKTDAQGGFQRLDSAPFLKPVGRDVTSIVPMLPGVLLAGSANFEDGTTNGGNLRVLDAVRHLSGEALLGPTFSTGPVAVADVGGDGQLQVFVGGRSVAGRYPEPATSLLLKSSGGRLAETQRFEQLGLVSGVCFSDLDGDGDPDLALAMEWGPVRFFRNDGGKLVPWEIPVEVDGVRIPSGLRSGWWNGIVAGDFDEDGRLDLIVSNWGRNTKYRATARAPRRLYYGDLGGAGGPGGAPDLFESYVEAEGGREWPERELILMRLFMPAVADRYPTFVSYAHATVPEILGEAGRRAPRLEATWLDSVVLLNRGDHFEMRSLPAMAQQAPAFGICVADYDGDGHEDVFLAQNWSSAQPMTQRNDGGRGLWLRGDGHGGFTAEPRTGVAVYGEQRGAAVADYDGDGRIDLVVSQNGAATTVWHNIGAKPGLRVRLAGPAGNPRAVGASVRLLYEGRRGPWREVHAGAGYWSTDGTVLVLGKSAEPTHVEVRWPGGKLVSYAVPVAAREVELVPDGTVRGK